MTSKQFPHYWTLCEGNPSVISGLTSQRSSSTEFWCFLCWYPGQVVEQTVENSLSFETQRNELCYVLPASVPFWHISCQLWNVCRAAYIRCRSQSSLIASNVGANWRWCRRHKHRRRCAPQQWRHRICEEVDHRKCDVRCYFRCYRGTQWCTEQI